MADGSQITLDSSSEVEVRYTANARALTLVRGQARFDVTHGSSDSLGKGEIVFNDEPLASVVERMNRYASCLPP